MASPDPERTPRLDSGGEWEDLFAALRLRLEQWPLPLAYPAEQCLRWASSPASLVNWSFQLYGQTLRLTSLYLAGAYLAGKVARTDLNTAIQEDLRRPLLGKWRGFLRDALDRLINSRLDVPLVRAIRDFHAAVGTRRDSPGAPTMRDGRLVRKPTPVLDALLEMRNDLVHGARGLDDDVAGAVLPGLAPLLKRLVEALDHLQGFRLIARSPLGAEIALHGPRPPDNVEDHVCELIDPEGNRLLLRPLPSLTYSAKRCASRTPRRSIYFSTTAGRKSAFATLAFRTRRSARISIRTSLWRWSEKRSRRGCRTLSAPGIASGCARLWPCASSSWRPTAVVPPRRR